MLIAMWGWGAVPVGDFQIRQTNAISAEMSVKEKDGFPAAMHI